MSVVACIVVYELALYTIKALSRRRVWDFSHKRHLNADEKERPPNY